MLDSAYCHIAFADYCAAVGRYHVFGQSVDYGLAFNVGALYFIAVVIGSRTECGLNVPARVEAFAFEGEFAVKSYLLHCDLYMNDDWFTSLARLLCVRVG